VTAPATIVFVAGALGLVVIGRRHLTRPDHHGFWRVWGFIALLGLVCQNARVWFVAPWAAGQLASWSLLILSGMVAFTAGRQLRVLGRPLSGIEPTTALVTDGIYAHVRHPLYVSLLLLVVGSWLKDVTWAASGWAVAAAAAILATAWTEEKELVAQFGEAYRSYRRQVRGFIPGIL